MTAPAGFQAGVPAQAAAVAPERSPSRWGRRLPVVALALTGCGISGYLSLYQLHVTGGVWDPFFGTGSERVLTSTLSRSLPVPDALLGAVGYAVEAVLELCGGPRRWRLQPFWVLLVGLVAAALAVTGVVLVVSQPLLVGTFCTLCLCSAALSWTIAGLVAPEVWTAVAAHSSAPARRRPGAP